MRDPAQLAYVTQTTLSVDDTATVVAALSSVFPPSWGRSSDDICYATQNRQDAVKIQSPQCDLVLVVGSPNSSNSNRLREVAAARGIPAYLVDSADELQAAWVADRHRVGVTAGASAPELLVQQVVQRLAAMGATSVSELPGAVEHVVFPMPRGLHAGTSGKTPETGPAG